MYCIMYCMYFIKYITQMDNVLQPYVRSEPTTQFLIDIIFYFFLLEFIIRKWTTRGRQNKQKKQIQLKV